jgi:protein-S-isoprenylcysteine O-methyltransferase Ste14
MTSRSDSPGVWFPPPLLYALAVLIGVLLDRRWPLPIAASPLTTLAGVIFVLGWVALALVSIGRFRRSNTSIVPIRPAEALVLTGPYRYTRNPMYVSLALLTAGCGLLLATWWPIVLLVPTLALVQQFVIVPEEQYLRRRFGTEYEAYTLRVRRWL